MAYVRLFASRHTESPCRTRRGLSSPSVLYGFERPHFARVPETSRAAEKGSAVDAGPVLEISGAAKGLCGLYSGWGKTHAARDRAVTAAGSRSLRHPIGDVSPALCGGSHVSRRRGIQKWTETSPAGSGRRPECGSPGPFSRRPMFRKGSLQTDTKYCDPKNDKNAC